MPLGWICTCHKLCRRRSKPSTQAWSPCTDEKTEPQRRRLTAINPRGHRAGIFNLLLFHPRDPSGGKNCAPLPTVYVENVSKMGRLVFYYFYEHTRSYALWGRLVPAVRPQALLPTPAPSSARPGPSNHRCGPVNKQASQLLVSRGHLPQKSSPEGRSVETERELHGLGRASGANPDPLRESSHDSLGVLLSQRTQDRKWQTLRHLGRKWSRKLSGRYLNGDQLLQRIHKVIVQGRSPKRGHITKTSPRTEPEGRARPWASLARPVGEQQAGRSRAEASDWVSLVKGLQNWGLRKTEGPTPPKQKPDTGHASVRESATAALRGLFPMLDWFHCDCSSSSSCHLLSA